MSYRLIKGEFHLFYCSTQHVGSRPDGDSIWFKPTEPTQLKNLARRSAKLNGGNFAQLRLEGIDALELHYKGSNHQAEAETVASRDRLLGLIGFGAITYAPSKAGGIDTSVRSAEHHPRRGYILTRSIDPFGRPVAFAFPGKTRHRDSSKLFLRTSLLERSLNAQLMADGHVYPGFYTGLPRDLRNHLTRLAIAARQQGRGLWRVHKANAAVREAADLEHIALWPKLYRRLFAYFRSGNRGLKGFEAWLRGDPERDDELWIISEARLGNLHDVVTVKDTRIEVTYLPEDLIIVPR